MRKFWCHIGHRNVWRCEAASDAADARRQAEAKGFTVEEVKDHAGSPFPISNAEHTSGWNPDCPTTIRVRPKKTNRS